MKTRILSISLISVAIFLAVSCGKKGVPPVPKIETNFSILSGNNQSIVAGGALTNPQVKVVNALGSPVKGVPIRFQQLGQNHGGHFRDTLVDVYKVTGDNGIVETRFVADTVIGAYTLQAIATGPTDSILDINYTVIAGAAQKDTILIPDQIGIAGDTLPTTIVAKISDRFNNPVAGARVLFIADHRGLAVTDSSRLRPYAVDSAYTRTDTLGLARARWVLPIDSFEFISPTMTALSLSGDSVIGTASIAAAENSPGTLTYYPTIRAIFAQHCMTSGCHDGASRGGASNYALNFYYEVLGNGVDNTPNVIPGDGSSLLLSYIFPLHKTNNINMVEADKVTRWVVVDSAAPGVSGLNSYYGQMKNIFDLRCVSCHGSVSPNGSYDMSSFSGIRGNGTDATPNAIPGDAASLLAVRVTAGGNMRGYLGVDSVALADSIVNWIVRDSIRDY